jgi:hypothetical protein
MNPALLEMIAQARTVEIRRTTTMESPRVSEYSDRSAAGIRAPRVTAGTRRPAAARRTIGWFLIRVGFHLALPRPHAASVR